MTSSKPAVEMEKNLIDAVLLIDGDNDPHLPPDFTITPHSLVRVFLRTGAFLPKGLERKLASLPRFVTVSSPKGGANAADFVMSLHVGILHATLPLHIPFMIVTADKSLSVAVQELQRIGRQATLWTSHPERGGRRRAEPAVAGEAAARPSSRRRRSSGRRPAAVPAAAAAVSAAATPAKGPAGVAPGGRSLAEVAASYAARLGRIKDPPSRLKTLINDIANRAGAGHSAEKILEELKLHHGVTVDESGKVRLAPPAQKL